jgi:hypothetical protein
MWATLGALLWIVASVLPHVPNAEVAATYDYPKQRDWWHRPAEPSDSNTHHETAP